MKKYKIIEIIFYINYQSILLKLSNIYTIYFIYNEHVLYKGSQAYGGVQSISYTIDSDGNYILTITDDNNVTSQLQVASSTNINRLIQAVELLQTDLTNHINTKGNTTTSAHVKLTDTPIFTTDSNGLENRVEVLVLGKTSNSFVNCGSSLFSM